MNRRLRTSECAASGTFQTSCLRRAETAPRSCPVFSTVGSERVSSKFGAKVQRQQLHRLHLASSGKVQCNASMSLQTITADGKLKQIANSHDGGIRRLPVAVAVAIAFTVVVAAFVIAQQFRGLIDRLNRFRAKRRIMPGGSPTSSRPSPYFSAPGTGFSQLASFTWWAPLSSSGRDGLS